MNWHIHEHLHISNEASKWKTGEHRVVFITLLTCLTRERGIWSHSFLTFFRPQLELELKTRHRLKNDRLPDFVHSETADEDVWNHQKSMRHTKSIYTSHPQKQFRPGTWSQLRRGNKGNRSDLNFAACVNIFWYNYKHITIHNIPTKGPVLWLLNAKACRIPDYWNAVWKQRMVIHVVQSVVPANIWSIAAFQFRARGTMCRKNVLYVIPEIQVVRRMAEQTSLAGSKWIYIKNMKK